MESHLGEYKAKITQPTHERWEGVLPAAGKETRVIPKVINNLWNRENMRSLHITELAYF